MTKNPSTPTKPKQPKQTRSFGQAIKARRLELGLSMGQVSGEAGISKSLLRFWELDEVDLPELGKVMRLAAVLGVEPLELCELAGYDLSSTLPTFQPYLRSKYKHLPPQARAELADSFRQIAERYGIDPNGPEPGEDE